MFKKKFFFFILLVTFTAFLITGCGFKLRSKSDFPQQLKIIYISATDPYSALVKHLRRELKNSGITIANNQQSAPVTLQLNNTQFTYRDTTTGPSTQARIYHLTMFTALQIVSKTGQILLDTQTVRIDHDLTLGTNEVFEVSSLVKATEKNMQKELIIKIFNLLNSRKIADAVATHTTAKKTP